MPRKANAVVLGHCPCESCGKRAAVFQNTRGYLYLRCDDCGADQRNGVKPQTYMWQNSEWLGTAPEKPRNVPDVVPESEPVAPVQEAVQEPVKEPIGEDWTPEQDEKPEAKGEGASGFVWGALALGVVGALVGLSR